MHVRSNSSQLEWGFINIHARSRFKKGLQKSALPSYAAFGSGIPTFSLEINHVRAYIAILRHCEDIRVQIRPLKTSVFSVGFV